MQWHTQGGSITTNIKVKIYFTLPELSATEILTWNCYVDDSAKGRYDMILGIDISSTLGVTVKFSYHVNKADNGLFKGFTAPMVNMITYEFKFSNAEKIKP